MAVVECKLVYGSVEQTIEQGLAQTGAYLQRCAAAEGHLVVFDRDATKELGREDIPARGEGWDTLISVWGM